LPTYLWMAHLSCWQHDTFLKGTQACFISLLIILPVVSPFTTLLWGDSSSLQQDSGTHLKLGAVDFVETTTFKPYNFVAISHHYALLPSENSFQPLDRPCL